MTGWLGVAVGKAISRDKALVYLGNGAVLLPVYGLVCTKEPLSLSHHTFVALFAECVGLGNHHGGTVCRVEQHTYTVAFFSATGACPCVAWPRGSLGTIRNLAAPDHDQLPTTMLLPLHPTFRTYRGLSASARGMARCVWRIRISCLRGVSTILM